MNLSKEWANVVRVIKFAVVFRDAGLESFILLFQCGLYILMGKFFRDFMSSVVAFSGDLVF